MRDEAMFVAGCDKGTARGICGDADRDVNLTEVTPLTEEMVQRLCDAAQRLNSVAAKIENHGNRLFGSQPEGTQGGDEAKRAEPQGIVDHLYLALVAVDDAIIRTSSAHARISRV